MGLILTEDRWYQEIAEAIRDRDGTDLTYLPSEMAAAIRSILTTGEPAYAIADGASPGTISASAKVTAYSSGATARTSLTDLPKHTTSATQET